MSKDSSRSNNKEIELNDRQAVSDAMDRAHEEATSQGCCCGTMTTLLYWCGCKCPCTCCLCCCCDNDNLNDHGLDSIVEERHFTDVPCCALFVAALIAQIVLFAVALQNEADPRWLIYYSDWEGNLCAPGSSAGEYAAWPDIRIYDVIICVDSCNDTLTDNRVITPDFDFDLDDLSYVNDSLLFDITGYETETFFDAYCVPSLETIEKIVDTSLSEEYQEFLDTYYDTIDQLGETLSLALDDLFTVRWMFIGCAVNAFIVSLLWGYFMRHCGGVIVWASILFTLFGVIIVSYYMITFSETAYDFGYDTIGDIMYYGGIVLGVGDGMFFLAICFMWHRIRLAIALAKETTRALNSMWGMFFYPALPFIAFLIYTVYWFIGWPFCASSMKGISIVFKNIVRSAALSMVSGYLEKLGKIAIISYNAAVTMLVAFYVYGDELTSLFLPTVICLLISWAVCFQYMALYEVGLETIFLCFLIDEEINKSKQFKDENGNTIIHPETGKPIGKMRASHRLYKLIGLKKPRIRANKRDVKILKETQRVRAGNGEEDRKMTGKSLKKIFFIDPDDDEPSSSSQSLSLYSSTRQDSAGGVGDPRPSGGSGNFASGRNSSLPMTLEMDQRLQSSTASTKGGFESD